MTTDILKLLRARGPTLRARSQSSISLEVTEPMFVSKAAEKFVDDFLYPLVDESPATRVMVIDDRRDNILRSHLRFRQIGKRFADAPSRVGNKRPRKVDTPGLALINFDWDVSRLENRRFS